MRYELNIWQFIGHRRTVDEEQSRQELDSDWSGFNTIFIIIRIITKMSKEPVSFIGYLTFVNTQLGFCPRHNSQRGAEASGVLRGLKVIIIIP